MEEPSHYRVLSSKHGDDVLQLLTVKERESSMQDFHSLDTMPEGKCAELFSLVDELLVDRERIKQLDETINNMQHKVLDARKQATEEEEKVDELKKKLLNVKKAEGPNFKDLGKLRADAQKLKEQFGKLNKDSRLRAGLLEALTGPGVSARYNIPAALNTDQYESFVDCSTSELISTINAIREYKDQGSGAEELTNIRTGIRKRQEKLERLKEENDGLRCREDQLKRNNALQEKLLEQKNKLSFMKREAGEARDKIVEAMADKETEDEMAGGLSHLNPVSIVNFFLSAGASAETQTAAQKARKKALEAAAINHAAAQANGKSALTGRRRRKKRG